MIMRILLLLCGLPLFAEAAPLEPVASPLAAERSPFLRRFAADPVKWWPWGAEAFQRAREQRKLVHLCIGYSSCPWTLQMQLDTYRDPTMAAWLNEHFICVLVDREDRPDLNNSFMRYAFVMAHRSGWPLHCWLTPGGQPVHLAIYLPAARQDAMPSFQATVEKIAGAWQDDPAYVEREAAHQAELFGVALRQFMLGDGKSKLDRSMLDLAYDKLNATFDPQDGGFTASPKFHGAPMLDYLLDYASYKRKEGFGRDRQALNMVTTTLRAMANGAMMDQLGGGFHRYCLDRAWTVPQFEKLLFDQGQLATTYLRAAQATGDPWFAEVARQTLEYVEQELSPGGGGFYSAENPFGDDPTQAGEKVDVSYYTWKKSAVDQLVGPEIAPVMAQVFGLEEEGNLPVELLDLQRKRFPQQNILRRVQSLPAAAATLHMSEADVAEKFRQGCAKMLVARQLRPRPQRDEKILPGWNALLISAFLKAGNLLPQPEYVQRAQAAADFTYRHFLSDDYRRPRFAEDYANLIGALLDLYETTASDKWLAGAVLLQERMDAELWDATDGGYWDGPAEPQLFARLKTCDEGAEFSPNAAAADNLIRLTRLLGDKAYFDRAGQIFQTFGGECSASIKTPSAAENAKGPKIMRAPETPSNPVTHIRMLQAYDHFTRPGYQFLLVGDPHQGSLLEMQQLLLRQARPNSHLLYLDGTAGEVLLARFNSSLPALKPGDGRPVVLIAREFKLEKRCTTAQELSEFLKAEY